MLPTSLSSFVAAVPPNPTLQKCAHCGARIPESGSSFCCSGCETVYSLLHSSGLDEYYAFRERLGAEKRSVVESKGGFSELDSPQFRQLFVKEEGESYRVELALEGLHCAACVWLVERLPRLEPDVESARVDFGRRLVELRVRGEKRPLSAIAQSLASLGYRPAPYRAGRAEAERNRELRGLLLRIGVAGAIAGNVMLMAFALYSAESGSMDQATRRFFEIGSLILSLPSLWAAGIFFRGAWASIRLRSPHMDLPIAIGISAGYLASGSSALLGRGELYFDSLTVLVFLLLIGRYLTRRHQMSAAHAAELLTSVTPAFANVFRKGSEPERAPIEEVALGERVFVRSGETIPVDGVVEEGNSTLDLSILSGESLPVVVAPGQEVPAGASNIGGVLTVRTLRAGADTKVAGLMREVERALLTRTPLVAMADRVAAVFTWAILAVAALVYLLWLSRDPSRALPNALALLVVSCPCALAMATPLALSAASAQASRRKILLFEVSALERLARPSEIYLDKTGTLTTGTLSVQRITGDESYLPYVLAMERSSSHPVAQAIATFLAARVPVEEEKAALSSLCSVTEVLGGGIVAKLGELELRIGSESFVGVGSLGSEFRELLASAEGVTSPLLFSVGGEARLVLFLADETRPGAEKSLRELHSLGHRLHLLSGDNERTVQALAQKLERDSGIVGLFSTVRGGVRPLEKLEAIEGAKVAGREVVMVGDGVNDAAALARADVGISVHGAAEASRLSADIFLGGGGDVRGVALLSELVHGARRTIATIRRGMIFSLLYNLVGLTLAATGALSPLWAAVLMPLSSLTVVTNAFKSRMFSEKP